MRGAKQLEHSERSVKASEQELPPLWLSVSEARRKSIDSFSPDLLIRNAID